MKVKLSLIPFIPIAVAMAALKLLGVFAVDGEGKLFGLSFVGVSYAVIGLALALFVLCIFFNIIDRKTAPVYSASKNIPAAVFAVISAVLILGSSALDVLNNSTDTEYYAMYLICVVFAVVAALAFVFIARVHFTGFSPVSNISLLYIFPSLWGCCELINSFLRATRVSVSSTDMTELFCWIFLTLYLFSHSMVISKIKGRNPVKASFIYGLPAISLSLTYGLYLLVISITDGFSGPQLINGAMFLSLAVYSICFIIELFAGMMTADEIEIVDSITEAEDSAESEYAGAEDYDDLVIAGNYDAKTADYTSEPPKDADDFILGYEADDEEPIPYLTTNEMKRGEFSGVFTDMPETADEIADYKYEALAKEPEASPKPEQALKEEPQTEPQAPDVSDDEAENARMSEIDRLLADLDSKK